MVTADMKQNDRYDSALSACSYDAKHSIVINRRMNRLRIRIEFHFIPLSLMDVLWFLIIGGVAGWIAGEMMRGDGFGIVGNIVVGIIGAVIGGFLFDIFNVTAYGLIGSLVMAVIGAVVLLFVINLFRGRRV